MPVTIERIIERLEAVKRDIVSVYMDTDSFARSSLISRAHDQVDGAIDFLRRATDEVAKE